MLNSESSLILAIICSNSFSHCKVDQKKTVAIFQMFNHVQLYVHWMHLLNDRICRYTYITSTVIYCDQDSCVTKLFNLENGLYCVQVRFLTKLDTSYSFLYLLSLIMCESVGEKIIASTLYFMHQRIFRPNYIFNNDAYFLDFLRTNFPLIFVNLTPF